MLLAYAISICRHCRRHKERGRPPGNARNFRPPSCGALPSGLSKFSFVSTRPTYRAPRIGQVSQTYAPSKKPKPGRLGGFRRGSFGTQRPRTPVAPIRTCALRLPAAAPLHVRAFWPSLPLTLAAALVGMGFRQRRENPSSGRFVEPICWAARQRNGWAPSCAVVRKKQERARTRVPAYQPIPLLGPARST
jgi:hypothetical protein